MTYGRQMLLILLIPVLTGLLNILVALYYARLRTKLFNEFAGWSPRGHMARDWGTDAAEDEANDDNG